MPIPTYPGVYVEEIGSGPPPITGVPTASAAFVDVFAQGPVNRPRQITSLADFKTRFGSRNTSPASHAIRDFFANGGSRAWVVRVRGTAVTAGNLQSGLQSLVGVDSFNTLCLPCAAKLADAQLRTVYAAALSLCASRRAFLIVDIPASVNTTAAMRIWLEQHAELRHANAAVYFPRLLAAPATESRALRSRPVSGVIAGLYARIDAARGVWQAPAGVEADLRGIRGLALAVTDDASALLTPLGVNVLRVIEGRSVCWGARTLSTDPEWRYVPVRRLALFIETSIERGLEWTAFEANGEALWAKVRQAVENFMAGLFRAGAFVGSTPDQTYFVHADRTTMTQNDIADGRLILLVGFAPLQPAEFAVLRIALTTAG